MLDFGDESAIDLQGLPALDRHGFNDALPPIEGLGFKTEAVRLVAGGQSIAAAARTLGLVEQTLYNWIKADRQGKLTGADSKLASAEQMEISRLRAELARVKMERDILGIATACFAKAQS